MLNKSKNNKSEEKRCGLCVHFMTETCPRERDDIKPCAKDTDTCELYRVDKFRVKNKEK